MFRNISYSLDLLREEELSPYLNLLCCLEVGRLVDALTEEKVSPYMIVFCVPTLLTVFFHFKSFIVSEVN